jgi:ABC-2 type transport system ATP-binding protein
MAVILTGMNAIHVAGLSKQYRVVRKREGLWASITGLFSPTVKTVEAVRGVSFEIERGEIVAFLGPNGAGKTTTLKLLSGLIHPTSGTATVLGHVPWKRSIDYRRRFALVMGQKNQLWWDLPARESFELHRVIYRIPRADFVARVDQLTSLLDVGKLVDQPVRELSLGERMKMELIAALLHAPEVLFLDEPTIGLDVVSQRRVQEFLREYQRERGITVILTSHYMKDVQALCRRAVIINEGEIKHDGPLADITDRFNTHKVVELQFAGAEVPHGLERYGEVVESRPPRAKIKVLRAKVPETLAALLAEYQVEDVGVGDRPLEEVIAEIFTATGPRDGTVDGAKEEGA